MKDERSIHRRDEITAPSFLDRRDFLKVLGGGIIIAFAPGLPVSPRESHSAGRAEPADDFNAYLRIAADGEVTCFTGKIEMGQGVIVSLAQMLADELDVPFDSVRMVMGDTDLCPWDAGTYGSRTTKYFGPELQAAAAEARAVLIELAAERLGAAPERLETRAGMVVDRHDPSRAVSYGALTDGKRITRRLEGMKPTLEHWSDYTIIGRSHLRTDAEDKVTGRAEYAGDIAVKDKIYARIVRPPAHGAKLTHIDDTEAKKIPGVRIARDGDLIAVTHPKPDIADKAFALLETKFAQPESGLNESNIFRRLLDVAPEAEIVAETGDMEAGRKSASMLVEATYTQGYVAHAPIEPHTAVAVMEDDKVTVWASTQRPFGARSEVASALNLPEKSVRIITPFVGGGFGGKNRNRQVVEAARLARMTGKPVQVTWTRDEEFFYDSFQPAAVIKISAGLDATKRITFWDYDVFYAGGGKAATFYDIANHRTKASGGWRSARDAHPFSVGPWRGPGGNTNTFARESHMDALAAGAGIDPLEFRLNHLSDKRMIRVLEAAAVAFNWSSAVAPSGKGRGVCCLIYKGTYVAAMGEAEVDESSGACRMKRIVCAQDMGRVVNPEGARMQVEGCLMMGLGYALTEMLRFKGGEILDRNFDTYELPRFSAMPKIETILIENPETPPQEGGEPAITCVGGLAGNAIFDAVGARVRELPITAERIKAAKES